MGGSRTTGPVTVYSMNTYVVDEWRLTARPRIAAIASPASIQNLWWIASVTSRPASMPRPDHDDETAAVSETA